MISYKLSCFIAIIVMTKSSVAEFGLPPFHFGSILPSINSSLIRKPIQSLYKVPLNAVNVLQRVNPFNYLSSLNPFQNLNDAENYGSRSSSRGAATQAPHYFQSVPINTPFPSYEKGTESYNYKENLRTSETETTTVSSFESLGATTDLVDFLPRDAIPADHFFQVLEQLDNQFYKVSFLKLLSISPEDRRENGISFAQSGFLLYLQLIALCTELDVETTMEITQSLGLKTTCEEQLPLLKDILSTLPKSNEFLKLHWSSRFVVGPEFNFSEKLTINTAPALQINLSRLDKTDDPETLTKRLNHMIDADSLWAMHDTFDVEELSDGVCAAWLTTMYVRARWLSAPTVLNGTFLFNDGDAPPRHIRMIKINDVMRYARLDEWDAEALEIRYKTPDLSLTILLPRGRSLRNLSERISAENLHNVFDKMQVKRIAVILPIYTLRMTLLLPGKLEMMGLPRLVDAEVGAGCQTLRLSHAVQRIMFWAEAGRNAFKDDGIEWDEAPELEVLVDRPYIFFVRWRNITLLNGNFVL